MCQSQHVPVTLTHRNCRHRRERYARIHTRRLQPRPVAPSPRRELHRVGAHGGKLRRCQNLKRKCWRGTLNSNRQTEFGRTAYRSGPTLLASSGELLHVTGVAGLESPLQPDEDLHILHSTNTESHKTEGANRETECVFVVVFVLGLFAIVVQNVSCPYLLVSIHPALPTLPPLGLRL